MPADNEASNARVTQAVLKQVVEDNTRALNRVNGNLNDLADRTRALEISDARQDERINNLNTKVKLDIAGTTIGGAILAVLAAFGRQQ